MGLFASAIKNPFPQDAAQSLSPPSQVVSWFQCAEDPPLYSSNLTWVPGSYNHCPGCHFHLDVMSSIMLLPLSSKFILSHFTLWCSHWEPENSISSWAFLLDSSSRSIRGRLKAGRALTQISEPAASSCILELCVLDPRRGRGWWCIFEFLDTQSSSVKVLPPQRSFRFVKTLL